jgi:hypothetical protein
MAIELSEETTREVKHIQESLVSARDTIEKKLRSVLDEFINETMVNFSNTVECDLNYNFTRWIRREVDKLMHGLLSGNMAYLKYSAIVSDYSFDKLQMIRKAIYDAAKDDILESALAEQAKTIQHLTCRLESTQEKFREYRNDNGDF